jgi:hypothetical protein
MFYRFVCSILQINEIAAERNQLLELLREQQHKNEQTVASQQQLTSMIQKRYATYELWIRSLNLSSTLIKHRHDLISKRDSA